MDIENWREDDEYGGIISELTTRAEGERGAWRYLEEEGARNEEYHYHYYHIIDRCSSNKNGDNGGGQPEAILLLRVST